MIESIYINNFKSLCDFELKLGKFNCLIGLNGCGKSTVLQAFDFLSHLMIGDIESWLETRSWSIGDLKFRLAERQSRTVYFKVKFRIDETQIIWDLNFSQNMKRCQSEKIYIANVDGSEGETLLHVKKDGKYRIGNGTSEDINFEYSGSILSQLNEKSIANGKHLSAIKEYIKNIKSMDLLSPHLLRANSRGKEDIGLGGERFPSFIRNLGVNVKQKLVNDIKTFYPRIENILVKSQRGGVKKLSFTENCGEVGNIDFEAKYINDGMLRTTAILSQLYSTRSMILFDEIENGINSELIEKLLDRLMNAESQVIITTHSPMILNYIPDDIATESVIFLYKKNGETRARKFFDIPQIKEKLHLLGPGEVYIDTNLEALAQSLADKDEALS